MKNKYIVLIGKPGSGKGTLAKSICDFVEYKHFVMGDVFRDHMALKTKLGIEIQEIMDSGNLVDDAITVRIFEDYVENLPKGSRVIIDGYPRSERQFESMMNTLESPPQIIFMDVSDSECCDRIQKRALLENRKEDASYDVISRRLDIFHKNLKDIMDAMDLCSESQFELIELDASKDAQCTYVEYLETVIKQNLKL